MRACRDGPGSRRNVGRLQDGAVYARGMKRFGESDVLGLVGMKRSVRETSSHPVLYVLSSLKRVRNRLVR